MIHNNKLFFCVLFLCALYNGLLGMEDAAVQTDNGFDKSKIEIPDRINFLHDQIIFRRINNNPEFNQTRDSLWILDYAIMLNIHKKKGIFHNLITDFSNFNIQLVFNSDELVSKDTIIYMTGIACSYGAKTLFVKIDNHLHIRFSSFTKETFKKILLDVLSYALLEFMLCFSCLTSYNICALADCQKPLREGPSSSKFFWDRLTLFHCGHIIHSEHLEKLQETDGPLRCPKCQTEVTHPYEDYIFIEQGQC